MDNLEKELVIEAGKTSALYWKDLWHFRGLLFFLVWRDLLVRYKQTVIGVAWAILPSIVTTGVFTIVFGKFARLSSGGTPYALLVLAAVLPWNLFSNALSQTAGSLLNNSQLITKVYFPRVLIPLSTLLVSFIDFLISCSVLVAVMVWYHYVPGWRILALPFFLLVALGAALGVGVWLAALNVRYRDFQYVIPFLVQLGLYLSPVGFNSNLIPPQYRFIYAMNPMVGVIDGFRWAILGTDIGFYVPGFLVSLLLVVALVATGLGYFRKVEKAFADVI